MILELLRRAAGSTAPSERFEESEPGVDCPTPWASRLMVITGAGMSADAGLPTYWGRGGRYETTNHPPIDAEDLFSRTDDLFDHIRTIRSESDATQPHAGHLALERCRLALSQTGGDLVLVTMNIDDLHERAGCTALHLHGRAWLERCTECDFATEAEHQPQCCPQCGAMLRPDVVLFGERTEPDAAYHGKRALRSTDAVYVVGCSGRSSPGVERWLLAARRDYKIPTVLITRDPQPPFVELFDIVIDDRAEHLARYLPYPS